MKSAGQRDPIYASGVIAVFFALSAAVFLGLFFALVESVRVQGARAQAANITDMGNYSLFSEYEKQLLTDYEIFSIDGSYGGAVFSVSAMEDRLRTFLQWNEKPAADGLAGMCFDPWQLKLRDEKITKYALLTDKGRCSFYQQAVSFMKDTAVTDAAGKLYQYYTDARKMEKLGEEYEETKAGSEKAVEEAESSAAAILEEAKKNGEKISRPVGIRNPLKEMAGVLRRGILENVLGTDRISDASVFGFQLSSHRLMKKGNLSLSEKHGGLADDLLFREYLLEHFPNYRDPGENTEGNGTLAYQVEYLIAGKRSDRQNLKKVASRLLLLRESVNYLFCVRDEQMSMSAEALALALFGWTGIPALVSAVKQGLLVAWAYGESLIDVRTIFAGGRIPLMKNADTWYLSLDQLGSLSSILQEGGKDRGEGLFYRDYLRLLLNLQTVSSQIRRGLDLVELNIRYNSGLSSFRVDHCVVAVKDETSWEIPPVFFRVTGALTGVSPEIWGTKIEAGFCYQ